MNESVIHELIHEMNGYKVMLDYDLAELYGVTTKALTGKELALKLPKILRSQIVILERWAIRKQPLAIRQTSFSCWQPVISDGKFYSSDKQRSLAGRKSLWLLSEAFWPFGED